MDRTERLFALMDSLRRHRRPVTAESLASHMSVSVRTIYRDVQTLIGLGATIDGEAGLGYLLRPGFFLPPLMFDEDELEALVLGGRWVQGHGDAALGDAAKSALAKIATASPKDLRDAMFDTGLWAAPIWQEQGNPAFIQPIREAIRREQKLRIGYVAENGSPTERTIWPFALAFDQGKRTVVAWCELREAFRTFRADRMSELNPMTERYPKRRAALMKAFRADRNWPQQE